MRARYYSPEMRRFINADIIAGELSNAITMNRYAYANGNPVSYVDPFGLSAWSWIKDTWNKFTDWVEQKVVKPVAKTVKKAAQTVSKTAKKAAETVSKKVVQPVVEFGKNAVDSMTRYRVVGGKFAKDIAGSMSRGNLLQKREQFLEKTSDVLQYAEESITVDIGFGAGFGIDVKMDEMQVGGLVREDFYTIKKDSGSTNFEIGKKSEEYQGVSAYGGFIGNGRERFTSLDAAEYAPENAIEPEQDWNKGFTFKGYFGLGFTFSIGFDVDHFLSRVVFS